MSAAVLAFNQPGMAFNQLLASFNGGGEFWIVRPEDSDVWNKRTQTSDAWTKRNQITDVWTKRESS